MKILCICLFKHTPLVLLAIRYKQKAEGTNILWRQTGGSEGHGNPKFISEYQIRAVSLADVRSTSGTAR